VELRHIRCALAVAEARHFGRAAERLFITQPALSQHIRNLERELRCQLFDRSARSVTLTPAGEVFIAGARIVLRDTDALVLSTRAAQVGETGTIAVGLDLASSESLLTQVLGAWAANCQGVRPRLASGRRSDLVDAVHNHDLDVALVDGPLLVPWATITTLRTVALGVILPVGHRLARQVTLDVGDLAGERLIGFPQGTAPGVHDALVSVYASAGLGYEVGLELDEPALVRMAVRAGLGLTVMAGVDEAVLPEGLVVVPLADERAVVPVVAVWRPDCSIQARAFVRMAARCAIEPHPRAALSYPPARPAC
jgi:DNA-binding transcriptional LysR family regulator